MKFLLAVAYLIAFSTALSGQLMTPEQVIRRTLHSGISEGHDQKIIGTMGDAAAVTLIKVLGGTVLTSQDMDLSLVVLSSSFAGLEGVEDASDREPRATLLLLRYFDVAAKNPQLKSRVAETRNYVLQRYEEYARKSSPR